MPKVAAIKTLVTAPEALIALRDAWVERYGANPSRASLCVLVAHWALETGHGKSCWNYNLGNVKSFQREGDDWCFFRCNEIIKGKVVWFDPDHPACCFMAYPSLPAGAAAYLAKLVKHFAPAWPAVLAGDPAAYSHLLKVNRYYTADETAYTRTLVSLFRQYMAQPVHLVEISIKRYQRQLQILGLYAGSVDGIDGPKTDAAVRAFQRSHALVVDGDVGRLTQTALNEAVPNV